MKKFLAILLTVSLILSINTLIFADNVVVDIVDEAQPTITTKVLDCAILKPLEKEAKVILVKGYYDGEDFVSLGKSDVLVIRNEKDDPETPEDESTTDYDNFITNVAEINIANVTAFVENNL